ncbi:MAG: PEP-CTERM sorting domain-containing protein [Gammaproteobacteria bacterium]|nr:PEP-CTERM sorting domain-containing protein [Gammaproteobacteria bacterium]
MRTIVEHLTALPHRGKPVHSATVRAAALLLVLLVTGAISTAHAGFIALDSTRVTGNQSYTGLLGMDFDVLAPIRVTHLGAFDSGQDGVGVINVGIFNRASQTLVAGLNAIIDGSDPLTGQSRFEDIADVVLGIGSYSIVAIGYNASNPNGNSGSVGPAPTINSGGLISFVNGGRYQLAVALAFPTIGDGGPANRYDAGTFQFEAASAIPAPATLALLGLGLTIIGFSSRAK